MTKKSKSIDEFNRKIENIVRKLIIIGYEMGKKQSKTPYKYTCATNKGKKYWKEIKKLKQIWAKSKVPKKKKIIPIHTFKVQLGDKKEKDKAIKSLENFAFNEAIDLMKKNLEEE